MYPNPLVWLGTWKTPEGLWLDGFHVWDMCGRWIGVYRSSSRAQAEARFSDVKTVG